MDPKSWLDIAKMLLVVIVDALHYLLLLLIKCQKDELDEELENEQQQAPQLSM